MEKYKQIKKVAIYGIITNVLLSIIKLVTGLLSYSQAMIADGINSLGDIVSSIMTLIGNKISSKPKDSDHPYGHGKAEYIFSLMIGVTLIQFAIQIIKNAIDSYSSKQKVEFSIYLILVSIVVIAIKYALYIYTKKVGSKTQSLLLVANSKDYRNDIFVTLGTLTSIIFDYFSLYIADVIVAIIIAIWTGYSGFKIIVEAYRVLMDTNIDSKTIDKIRQIVLKIRGISHIDDITSKPTGLKYLIIIKVSVPGNITVNTAHKAAAIIRRRVNKLDKIADTIVHINPS